jgi:hypothetical protein
MGMGKYIHSQIPFIQLDHKDLTFEDYTKRFQEQNQKFQDASDAIKHNRAKMNSEDLKTGMNVVTKPFISNNFSNKNDMNPRIHNDKQLVQYHNPHQRKLNVLSKNHYNNEYNNDNDEYNDDCDEYNDDCYDIDEVFGGRNDSIEGHNPGYNVTNTLISNDRDMTKLPCFTKLQGKCQSPACKYSHDFKFTLCSLKANTL